MSKRFIKLPLWCIQKLIISLPKEKSSPKTVAVAAPTAERLSALAEALGLKKKPQDFFAPKTDSDELRRHQNAQTIYILVLYAEIRASKNTLISGDLFDLCVGGKNLGTVYLEVNKYYSDLLKEQLKGSFLCIQEG